MVNNPKLLALIFLIFSHHGAIVKHGENKSNANLSQTRRERLHQQDGFLQSARPHLQLARIPGRYLYYITKYASKYHVRPSLPLAILMVENGLFAGGSMAGAAHRVSNTGAIGPMQIEPGTAQFVRINPWDLKENIKGGVKYLRYLLQVFPNYKLAIAAYNMGPTFVSNHPASAVKSMYVKMVLKAESFTHHI